MSMFSGKFAPNVFKSFRIQHFYTAIRLQHYQVVVLGGGTGGASISNALGRKLGKLKVAVVEPSDIHYYQGTWTLIGAGVKPFHQCHKPTSEILTDSTWLKDSVQNFSPESNVVHLKSGKELKYDALIIALGLQLKYDLIKGLPEAFSTPGVCSSYHQDYVNKTYESIKQFKSGNAVFTYPQTAVKCPGAAQKTMYLAEDYFRKNGKRDQATIMYCTSANFMFGVKAYNKPLEDICDKRNIIRNYGHTLVEIGSKGREAIFDVKDAHGKIVDKKTIEYGMIHITPPCFSPDVLQSKKSLVDETGYLNVNKDTLQHVTYPNIFGIGDCTNVPTSKTAAAAAVESGVLQKNVIDFLKGQPLNSKFNGYASCPLVTGFGKGILPEFDYSMTPLETFPLLDQSKERRLFYWIKADLLPILYWRGLVRGRFNGPQRFRKWIRLGFE